ncbi:MAG: hypothetical protein QG623_689 [Patescibacteria group bacterium]|nr:hypothetical protein [Patescibacteria group bacterium]
MIILIMETQTSGIDISSELTHERSRKSGLASVFRTKILNILGKDASEMARDPEPWTAEGFDPETSFATLKVLEEIRLEPGNNR